MNMKPDYHIHENIYVEIKKAGWQGWGGDKRLEGAKLVSRFFDLEHSIPTGKLLELGCGEGHHCRAFAECGYKVTGVDISPTAVKWAQEKSYSTGVEGTYFVADLSDANLILPDTYQVVIDGNCLHCIIANDRAVFLQNVYAALAVNGVFFVSSLCSQKANSYLTYKNDTPYRHVGTVRDLTLELQESGFKILKTEIYQRSEYNHITIHALKTEPLVQEKS